MAINFTKETFQEQVRDAKATALVDFWAPWCGPCKMQGPILEELKGETDAVIGKIDVDEQSELSKEFRIMSVPTIIAFKDGQEVNRVSGLQNKEDLLDMLK